MHVLHAHIVFIRYEAVLYITAQFLVVGISRAVQNVVWCHENIPAQAINQNVSIFTRCLCQNIDRRNDLILHVSLHFLRQPCIIDRLIEQPLAIQLVGKMLILVVWTERNGSTKKNA